MAQDVIDVILGEAKGGSWEDMLGVASVIYNRARDARATPEQIVKIPSQFNAYGKALPAGVGKYRSLAQKAWDQVQKTGPVHDGSYQMSGGLKPKVKGLVEVAAVPGGHVYYKDPQARPIATTEGYRKPQPIQTAQLTGKASASAEDFADLGKKGNGLGLMNLAPSMVANDGTVKTAMADPRMNPKVGEIAASLNRGGFGDVGIRSGFRTVAENRAVGGARNSQHLYGTAMDLGVKDLPDQQKADILDRALMGGAKGIGLYNSGAMHVDARENPAFWGPNRNDAYAGTTAAAADGWARPMIEQALAGGPYLPMQARNIPIPTPRQPMALMAQAKAADRTYNPGGIVGAKAISLNPVSSAQAGEMPKITRSPLPAIQERVRPMPTGAQAKTSTGVGYSLPKAQPLSDSAFSARYSPPQPAPKPSGPQTLYNRSGGAANDFRPMPTGTIPQRVSAPVQSTPAPRYNPLPSGPVAPSVSPQTMAAAYGQYGQTRMAAPSTPIQETGTPGTMTPPQIAGPLSNAPIQAPVATTTGQFKKFTPIQKIQQKLKTAVEPENLKAMGGQLAGGAAGSLLGGPIGGILGGLIGKQIMSQPHGQGLLAGIFGGGNNGYQGQSTYIGNGVNAVDRAMYGNRAGDTATYNSQGGGTVTNLGNGSSQRTSSKYGWTETTHADGSKSIKYK